MKKKLMKKVLVPSSVYRPHQKVNDEVRNEPDEMCSVEEKKDDDGGKKRRMMK
jgi:hypothetical protein